MKKAIILTAIILMICLLFSCYNNDYINDNIDNIDNNIDNIDNNIDNIDNNIDNIDNNIDNIDKAFKRLERINDAPSISDLIFANYATNNSGNNSVDLINDTISSDSTLYLSTIQNSYTRHNRDLTTPSELYYMLPELYIYYAEPINRGDMILNYVRESISTASKVILINNKWIKFSLPDTENDICYYRKITYNEGNNTVIFKQIEKFNDLYNYTTARVEYNLNGNMVVEINEWYSGSFIGYYKYIENTSCVYYYSFEDSNYLMETDLRDEKNKTSILRWGKHGGGQNYLILALLEKSTYGFVNNVLNICDNALHDYTDYYYDTDGTRICVYKSTYNLDISLYKLDGWDKFALYPIGESGADLLNGDLELTVGDNVYYNDYNSCAGYLLNGFKWFVAIRPTGTDIEPTISIGNDVANYTAEDNLNNIFDVIDALGLTFIESNIKDELLNTIPNSAMRFYNWKLFNMEGIDVNNINISLGQSLMFNLDLSIINLTENDILSYLEEGYVIYNEQSAYNDEFENS